jgi:peroxiredoxin
MRRIVNWPSWAALFLSFIAFLSLRFFFERFPLTRNFPWVNLLMFAGVVGLLEWGKRQALAPGRFRVLRIAQSLGLSMLSVLVLVTFLKTMFVDSKRLPPSIGAPQVGTHAPEFALLDEHGRSESLASMLSAPIPGTSQSPKGLLLVFYMYSGCRACNSEFHGIQESLDRFTARGVRPVAISLDLPETSLKLSQEAGYTFTFLSDPSLGVIRRYDLDDGGTGARPAEFLLDRAGVVRWRNLTGNVYVRAEPDQLLAAAGVLD